MKYLLSAAVLLFVATTVAYAQVTPQVNFTFSSGVPQGAFAEQLDKEGFGFTAFGGIAIDRTPLVVGVLGSYYVYGKEGRREPLSANIPDIVVEVETENVIFSGHLVARVQPSVGRWQLFGDALVGFNHFFTETSLKQESILRGIRSDNDIISSTNLRDTALSYGVGGGLGVRVYRTDVLAVRVLFSMRYLLGGNTKYLVPGAIDRSGGVATLHTARSKTDMLTTSLGVGFTMFN